jgi:hypothetical protein
MAVVQFGFAMMPLCSFDVGRVDLRHHQRDLVGSMRNALELSTTTQPALAAMGANSREMLPPALKRAMSMPAKESA